MAPDIRREGTLDDVNELVTRNLVAVSRQSTRCGCRACAFLVSEHHSVECALSMSSGIAHDLALQTL